jgi:hypothetical protein
LAEVAVAEIMAVRRQDLSRRLAASEYQLLSGGAGGPGAQHDSGIDFLKPTGEAGLPGRPDLCASSADSANSAKACRSISNLKANGAIGAGSSLGDRAALLFC